MGADHRVVILGGGFGGLRTAQALRRASVQVTVIDRRNFHLFQPLLDQVGTGPTGVELAAATSRSDVPRAASPKPRSFNQTPCAATSTPRTFHSPGIP